jgi:Na+-transporting NADH:ubiquinone oxidoreductase subunit NqrF
MTFFKDYVNSLVVVRQSVDLFDDYVSIRTNSASDYKIEVGFIAISGTNATMGYLYNNLQNTLLDSLYNVARDAIFLNPDPAVINPKLISVIGDLTLETENTLLSFSQSIADEL